MTLAQLEGVCTAAGMKRFVAKQLADWLYKKRVTSIDQMTNLSKENRARLSAEYEVGHMKPAEVMTSRDGTRKYAFEAVRPALRGSANSTNALRASSASGGRSM